ncbi:MAG: DUF1801 domain-containing protein [Saprospiraceae bacterium]|nr:DUF1801 domain-containing protein [Saprospiraceae bacterium]
MINPDTLTYNESQTEEDVAICHILAEEIDKNLKGSENKIWHRHPVWFLDGNPIVGYSKLKSGIRLMFWSGQAFEDNRLKPVGKFPSADINYTSQDEINKKDLKNWLKLGKERQWDYKNIVKRKGVLVKLTEF